MLRITKRRQHPQRGRTANAASIPAPPQEAGSVSSAAVRVTSAGAKGGGGGMGGIGGVGVVGAKQTAKKLEGAELSVSENT